MMMAQKWTNSFRESNAVRNARREKALKENGFNILGQHKTSKGGNV